MKYLKVKCGKLYKCPQSDEYYALYNPEHTEECLIKIYRKACPNDYKFYQVCGHHSDDCSKYKIYESGVELLCGHYICQMSYLYSGDTVSSGNLVTQRLSCNHEQDCKNTEVDEQICQKFSNDTDVYTCKDKSFHVNPRKISSELICDMKCDCYNCDDEAICNNVTYGIFCKFDEGNYLPPFWFCHNFNYYHGWGNCYKNEENCENQEVIRQCVYAYQGGSIEVERNLYASQICAVPNTASELEMDRETCSDGLDQINCADVSRVALTCKRNSTTTTVSVFGVCKGYKLCDDGYENLCVEPELGCVIHRNQLCDKRYDCMDKSDESFAVCSTLSNATCVRRQAELRIPMDWVMDNFTDCIGGEDENLDLWRKCGKGHTTRYVEKNSFCQDVFVCPKESGFVFFEVLCDRIPTCPIENVICRVSRNLVTTWNKVISSVITPNTKFISHCLPGMDKLSRKDAPCETIEYPESSEKALGVTSEILSIPNKADCKHTFGELYTYLSCTGACLDTDCPLQKTDHCKNIPTQQKVYTITSDYNLTMVRRSKNQYYDTYFGCENKKCISFEKVCDLANDCGDHSDEKNCTNHFKCEVSGEYIPLTAKCDSKIDCSDFSDECNDDCRIEGRHILDSLVLKIFSFVIGFLAMFFNIILIQTSLGSFAGITSFEGRLNKLLILLVSIGDLLTGMYLFTIASVDTYFTYNSDYCRTKYVWLTSSYCATLGVVSTVGSQISLFSMTVLSISRYKCSGTLATRDATSRRSRCELLLISLVIVISSLVIALIPLLPKYEDFFVNGLYYHEVPLFTGLVDKQKHIEILKPYHGRFSTSYIMSLENIRKLVAMMFTDDYSGTDTAGSKVHFYGNSGVCVFKYLVTPSDSQQLFSSSILLLNFLCFLLISAFYIMIHRKTVKSARSLSSAPQNMAQVRNRNNKLQFKISMIILTDFLCWIPFILVCGVHLLELTDASSWYPFLSIIVLPINSVVNPLLYDDKIASKISVPFKYCFRMIPRLEIGPAAQSLELQVKQTASENLKTNTTGYSLHE